MASETISASSLRLTGARIEVLILPSSASGKPQHDPVRATLLIDTGASSTVIDQQLLGRLGTMAHGAASIASPMGKSRLYRKYDVDIALMGGEERVRNIEVVEADFSEQEGIDGLIGRDILAKGLLIYNGKENNFTLTV